MVRSETSITGCGVTGHAAGFETSRLQRIPTWSTTNSSPSWPGAVMPLSGAVTAVVTGVRVHARRAGDDGGGNRIADGVVANRRRRSSIGRGGGRGAGRQRHV